MKILEVKTLTKRWGDFTAVDNISFYLKEGEILGMLGPNGAGKTTTIQMLLGVLTPSKGQVLYFGKDLQTHRSETLEYVNFSSTYTNLPWGLTVKENLNFLSYLYNIADRKKRISKIVHMFKLEELLKQEMRELSAGQTTRVNLAKAFINFPKVLLLDEPTASLDPDVAAYIRHFILNQKAEFKVSIILTSHNMSEVEEVCDRVLFIKKGKIIADDSPVKLAKTIEIAHVHLLVESNTKKLMYICEEQKLSHHTEGNYTIVDMKESQIPKFLNDLAKNNIKYSEISIDKPNLEDFFLEAAK